MCKIAAFVLDVAFFRITEINILFVYFLVMDSQATLSCQFRK